MQNYFEGFAYSKVTIDADAIKLLKKEEINFLKTLEIQRFIDQEQMILENKKKVI